FTLIVHGTYLPGVHAYSVAAVSGSGFTNVSVGTILVDPSLPATSLDAPSGWTGLDTVALHAAASGNASDMLVQLAAFPAEGPIDLEGANWTTIAEGGEWAAASFELNASLSTHHMVRYVVRAGAANPNTGLRGPWNVSSPFTADLLRPTVGSVDLIGGRQGLVGTFEATDQGSGPTTYAYELLRGTDVVGTGSGATSGNGTIAIEGPIPEGNYRLRLLVADAVGHTSDALMSEGVDVSDGPPTVPTISHPADGAVLDALPELAWNASVDPEGGEVRYLLAVDGPGGTVVSTTLSGLTYGLAGLEYGTYEWSVSSTDGTYTSEPAMATFSFARPDLTCSFIFYTNRSVTAIDTPGAISVVVRVRNVGLLPSGTFETVLTREGVTVRRTTFDGIGPNGSDTVTYSVSVDIGVHEFTLIVDPNGSVEEMSEYNNEYALTLTVGRLPVGGGGGGDDVTATLAAAAIAVMIVLAVVAFIFLRRRSGPGDGRKAPLRDPGPGAPRRGAGQAGGGRPGTSKTGGRKMASRGTAPMKLSEYEKLRRQFQDAPGGEQDVDWERKK
ncbi:MAG: hypothetical protein L0Z54_01000, partial [Thermoplasmata archaeon]|nr:hypothetical protein [Thermoplasmata archaeon]